MYSNVSQKQLKFYLLFEIQGKVCPLHAMPGYSCEHYNQGTCIYEEDCVYYPQIDDTKLIDLLLLAKKYSSTIYHVDYNTREDLKNVVLEILMKEFDRSINTPYSTRAIELGNEVRKVFGQN